MWYQKINLNENYSIINLFVIKTVYQVIISFCIWVGFMFSIPLRSLRICCRSVSVPKSVISCKVTLSMPSDPIGFVKTQVYLTRRSSRKSYAICVNWFSRVHFFSRVNIQNKHNRLKLIQVDWIPGFLFFF